VVGGLDHGATVGLGDVEEDAVDIQYDLVDVHN